METHGGNSATRATDLANGCRHLGHPGDVLGLHHRAESPYWPGHRAGQHVDVRLNAEDGYTAERECSIASAPGEPLAITAERWWGWKRSATSAAGSLHHARHEPIPTTTPYRRTFLKGFEHASDHRTGP